jgi:hypothetical protein
MRSFCYSFMIVFPMVVTISQAGLPAFLTVTEAPRVVPLAYALFSVTESAASQSPRAADFPQNLSFQQCGVRSRI